MRHSAKFEKIKFIYIFVRDCFKRFVEEIYIKRCVVIENVIKM